MIDAALVPVPTLAEVYGPGVAYVPRRSPNLLGWSPPLPGQVDFLTGLQLGLAGGMPYVACAASATPRALALSAEAGLPIKAEIHTYRTVLEYLSLLASLLERGYRLATQRVHPESEVPPHQTVPRTDLLAELNDKGALAGLVPSALVPARRTWPVSRLPDATVLLASGRPVVLKAATRKPSGGGHGVWICRAAAEVDRARALLAGEEGVVVEEYLEIDATFCIHGVVYPDGRFVHTGSAEEVVRNGRWLGNWHDARGDAIPDEVLAAVRDTVTHAAARGYRGITGIDAARLVDGSWRLIDLNFRVNGSTAGAWLRGSISRTHGAAVMRGRGWTCPGGFDLLCRVARDAVRRGTLVPLGFYDPDAADMGGLPRMGGLLLGDSREAIEEEDSRLRSLGLE